MSVFNGFKIMDSVVPGSYVSDFSTISILGRHDSCGGSRSSFSLWGSNNTCSVRQTRFTVRGQPLTLLFSK
jgi:hypothetical protein